MKVTTNPPPQPEPPKTYNLEDLTEEQMVFLVNIIGRCGGNLSWSIYREFPRDLTDRWDIDYFGKSLPREISPRPAHEIEETW